MEEKISIDELNYAIDECREKMEGSELIKYSFLEYASEEMTKQANFEKKPVFVNLYNHEEAVGLVLDFFKSLGVEEWYNRAKDILFAQNKQIGINIFDYSKVQNTTITDKNGIRIYSPESSMEGRIDEPDGNIIKGTTPKAVVRISKNSRYLGFPQIFPSDKISLEDIQTMVHEISHTFDLENSVESVDKRNLIAEITPFCFEQMFGEYLKEKKIINNAVIDSIDFMRKQDVMHHSRYVYIALNLLSIQEEEGEITKENLDRFFKGKDIHDVNYIRECLMDVIDSNYDIDFHVKYMIAGIASTSFLKMFKHNKTQALEKLLEYCKCIREANISDKTLKLVGFSQEYKNVKRTIDEFIDSSKGSR